MSKQALITKAEALTARIAADTEALAKLQAQVAQFDLIAAVDVGSVIQFKVGRADTRALVNGTVVAAKSEEDGTRRFKAEYIPVGGTDFDKTFAVVAESQIEGVVLPEAEEAEAVAE